MNTPTARRTASVHEISLTNALARPGGAWIHTFIGSAQPQGRATPGAVVIDAGRAQALRCRFEATRSDAAVRLAVPHTERKATAHVR
jgi:hypothetical protein